VDKRVIFAVAGSGKTTRIVNSLDLTRRCLLVTYTDNNMAVLRQKVVERFGYFPTNVTLYSYFTFLHVFCYKPLFQMKLRTRGISFACPPLWTLRFSRTDKRFYVDAQRRLYHNRIAKLLIVAPEEIDALKKRIAKYFDVVCFDEVQDFGGHDFDLLTELCKAPVEVLLVGDFYQHTFDTSRDGTTNKSLHDEFQNYKSRFVKAGLLVDTQSLAKSWRCPESVCLFIREHLGIEITSDSPRRGDVVFLERQEQADEIYACQETVKLFYQEHYKYDCFSQNWGGSKGMEYQNVCAVLNASTLNAFQQKALRSLNPQTRNRLYVACSRAREKLYFVSEKMFKKVKTRQT
jgi:DNA helicase-2/ATP-dependent DNA helicase PcrA